MFTPAMLSEQKMTLNDLAASVYDHETQTRKTADGAPFKPLASDTQFDGERQ
jgi:hypothetical protein